MCMLHGVFWQNAEGLDLPRVDATVRQAISKLSMNPRYYLDMSPSAKLCSMESVDLELLFILAML